MGGHDGDVTAGEPASVAPLPSGTVTLLFTDIEGSTVLLRRLGERYAEVLSAQREVLRSIFAACHGHEMGTEGDSFFVVFETAGSAVTAAVAAQRELGRRAWPDGVSVRVRMGLHTGEPQRHEDGYVGMDVHRAARIAASAHGGQVVVSEATCRLVGDQDVGGPVQCVDLGRHRLKDLPQPEHLFQLRAVGLDREFPPLRSLGAGTSLPPAVTSLVGRDGELAELRALVQDDAARLLTLTGPGGSGKTRLAVALAASLESDLPDGVYFVPLETARSADVMRTTVAEVLGLAGEGDGATRVSEYLASARVMLVLDNLEQLAGAADVVSELLGAGAGVLVLATSRRPLHLHGEHEHQVPPLTLPGAGDDAQEAARSGAVALFVQRARLVRPDFALTSDNVADVTEICRHLDGLPLALELAAARLKVLGPRAIRARLDQGAELASRQHGRPDRQQTLRDAIAWSYDLLRPDLQRVFRRLGVFSGDFGLDALADVVGDGVEPLDHLAEIIDVNLAAVQEGPDGEPRAHLLNTIADFAEDLLVAADEAEEVRLRHARHYLAFAERWGPQLRTDQFVPARRMIEAELDNIRAALAWSLRADDPGRLPSPDGLVTGLGLTRQLSWFWYACGYQSEGRRWLGLAVDAASGQQGPELMIALHGLAVLLQQHGENDHSRDLLRRCLEYWQAAGDPTKISMELNSLGAAHRALGEPEVARELLVRAADVARAAGLRERLANPLSNLAMLEADSGHGERGIELLGEVLEIDRELGDAWGESTDQVNIAGMLVRVGRVDEAYAHLLAHAPAAVALGDVELTVDVIDLCCLAHAARGDHERAARLAGASQAIRDRLELPMPDPDAEVYEAGLEASRDAVEGPAWDAALAQGRSLTLEEAVAEALLTG